MDKDTTLNQLFDAARTTPPEYSFTEARQFVVNQTVTNSGSTLPTKQSFFTLKIWIMLFSITAVLTTSLFLFKDNTNPNRIANQKVKPITAVVDSNFYENNPGQKIEQVKSTPTYSSAKLLVNQLIDSLKIINDINPPIEDISTIAEQVPGIPKSDDPYIFAKLTEKEIKETQKQKKAMLRALEKMDKKSYAFIPSGSIEYTGKTVSIQSFIMQKTEVSNLEYRTFLFDLLIQGRKEEFLKAKPDQKQWSKIVGPENSTMDPLENMYFSHPGYNNYPVVNISREGAEMYCKWVLEELRKQIETEKKQQYNTVRLPSRIEWVYAASSGGLNFPYPWIGQFLRNSEGCYLANFQPSINGYLEDGGLFTVGVNSYEPNRSGIYNLSGNVAEMVYNDLNPKTHGTAGGGWMNSAEELKILGPDPYSGVTSPHPCIGFRVVMTVTGGW